MNVLIIGSGGREHAVADAFRRSPQCHEIYVSPGNAGIKREFTCIVLRDDADILKFCCDCGIDLVFIGPEQPIAAGLSDYLRSHEIKVFAPSQAAARLETSKAFAKSLMQKHQVPTARYALIHDLETAAETLIDFTFPLVLKADGLAAGKGVLIAQSHDEAITICQELLKQKCGSRGVLAEEYLKGWEVSLLLLPMEEITKPRSLPRIISNFRIMIWVQTLEGWERIARFWRQSLTADQLNRIFWNQFWLPCGTKVAPIQESSIWD